MQRDELLAELRRELLEICDLHSAMAVLDWDQATYMPERGAEARGRQIALLGRLAHERKTSRRMRELLSSLARLRDDDSIDGALVREATRDHERAARLPTEFVAELKAHLAASYVAWTQARPRNDYGAVRPFLERTLELSRRQAAYYPEADHVADPLIDRMDRGMTAQQIRSLFTELRTRLVPLVSEITAQAPVEAHFLGREFPEREQLDFGREVVERLGYDFTRGRQDKTHHPFMTRFSAGDIRITNRVELRDPSEALFGSIHEAGHALYEQNIRLDLDGTPLAQGVSAGVHESQSRLWENLVGRSRPFWQFFFPRLREYFPRQLEDVNEDAFYRGINRVARTLKRTSADEVTYNLHVMLRFELEMQMLEGSLAIKDLPDAWNERMQADLGCAPSTDTDGVMQDVHWYCEAIGGFFQGYTLGNLMSAQFYAAATAARPSIPSEIAMGNFSGLRSWLTEEIYRHGSIYDPLDVVERATKRPLSVEPFIHYLRTKYGELYQLNN